MNVLHISHSDLRGGSARSAYRIHTNLKALGLSSRMLVAVKESNNDDIDVISCGVERVLDRFFGRIERYLSMPDVFIPSSFILKRREWYQQADILQLYNIHPGYFSYTALSSLSTQKPIVWRLSDMWPMTGHCGYSYDCERWQQGCYVCDKLDVYPALYVDLARYQYRLKERAYKKSNIHIIAPSRWIENLAQQSPLLSQFPITYIPNGINEKVYNCKNKQSLRKQLSYKPDHKYILFNSVVITDERKGGKQLLQAMTKLRNKKNLTLLIVGDGDNTIFQEIGCRVIELGYLSSDEELAQAYGIADVFIHTALAENLPNTILESMSCGTPVIAFDVGGVSDAVIHEQTGLLVQVGDINGLRDAIDHLINDQTYQRKLSTASSEKITNEFNLEQETRKIKNLYESILS